MFLHGGGTVEGFDCFLPLAERFRLVVPYHPGFGLSGDRHRHRQRRRLRTALRRPLRRARDRRLVLVRALVGWLGRSDVRGGPPEAVRGSCSPRPYGLDAPGHLLANIPAMSPDRDPRLPDEGLRPCLPARCPFLSTSSSSRPRRASCRSAGRVMPGPFDPTLERKLADVDDADAPPLGRRRSDRPGRACRGVGGRAAELRSVVFPGRGHLLFHEDPEAVAAVLAFAEELP